MSALAVGCRARAGRGINTMSDTLKLRELLDRWERAREEGHELQLEELCRDCPELRESLRSQINAIVATQWFERKDALDDE
jgi:hypothetical protein